MQTNEVVIIRRSRENIPKPVKPPEMITVDADEYKKLLTEAQTLRAENKKLRELVEREH